MGVEKEQRRQVYEFVEEHAPGAIMDPNLPLDDYLPRILEAMNNVKDQADDIRSKDKEIEDLNEQIEDLEAEVKDLKEKTA